MEQNSNRLFFIDAMRAWAILMMLQGHFVDGLLDPVFRDPGNTVYTVWSYFRGITAPVFFTVSGFIFTYLLIRVPQRGADNPRVKKGIRRGLQLLFIGYLLRLNLFGLLKGEIYEATYLVDVLHCIGLSLLGIIGIYLLTAKRKSWVFPTGLVLVTLLLFLFEPMYKQGSYAFLPEALANYFTKANGSVFTIIPWFGYAAFGAFVSWLFTRYKSKPGLYPAAISLSLLTGFSLIFLSSPAFAALAKSTGIGLFQAIFHNNYLFIRLGDVLVIFGIFMMFRKFMTHPTLLRLGQNTLAIYIIHFVILYGTFTGLGIYYFLHHSLAPSLVVPGALGFMVLSAYAALQYDARERQVKDALALVRTRVLEQGEPLLNYLQRMLKSLSLYLLRLLGWVKL